MFVPISCDFFLGGGAGGGVFCFLKKKKGALIHLKFFVTRVSVSVENKSIAHSQICTTTTKREIGTRVQCLSHTVYINTIQ